MFTKYCQSEYTYKANFCLRIPWLSFNFWLKWNAASSSYQETRADHQQFQTTDDKLLHNSADTGIMKTENSIYQWFTPNLESVAFIIAI